MQEVCENKRCFIFEGHQKLKLKERRTCTDRIVCLSLQESKTPLPPEQFVPIWEDCKDMGVLLGKGGLYGNVSTLAQNLPPRWSTLICISQTDLGHHTRFTQGSIPYRHCADVHENRTSFYWAEN